MQIDLNVMQHVNGWLQTRTWVDYGELFFVLMSIVGQHYIAARKLKGFYFWLAGNIVAVLVWTIVGRIPTALLYCYFTYKCVTGVRTWRKLEEPAVHSPAALPAGVLQSTSRA